MTLLDILIAVYLGYPTILLMVYTFVSIVYYINHIPGRPAFVLLVGLVTPQIVIGITFALIMKIVTSKVEYIKRRI